tara:strand:- start:156 stop:350 length:195 start_codon:yes stop_codon:yes gene_type:complete
MYISKGEIMKIKNKFYLRGRKIVKYDAVQKEVDGTPDVVITNVYNLMEVLNECIDNYHERHKHG